MGQANSLVQPSGLAVVGLGCNPHSLSAGSNSLVDEAVDELGGNALALKSRVDGEIVDVQLARLVGVMVDDA